MYRVIAYNGTDPKPVLHVHRIVGAIQAKFLARLMYCGQRKNYGQDFHVVVDRVYFGGDTYPIYACTVNGPLEGLEMGYFLNN